MGFADQRVVIVGGTSGVGLEVGAVAARDGALVTVASRSQKNVDAALDRLPESARGYRLDATNEADVQDFFKQVGEFDHLIFAAGVPLRYRTLGETTMEEARESFALHYWGAYMAAKYGAPGLCVGGSIVLTSSILAVRPAPTVAAAAGAMAAVESLTRALAVELAPIRVNAVRVGPLERKPRPVWYGGEPDTDELFKTLNEKLLTKRVGGRAEVAGAYLHLMENGYATGGVLAADGGYALV
jgi:NAD(P)-dependent dehydrogenase (short-subunit alcohol dehydrogenase family)